VREVVESCNCTFQEVNLENDIGNDAFIEFIKEEEATGCCIGAQIKSGDSYISSDRKTYYLRADKDHFQYWKSHLLPIVGIVFSPSEKKAVWCDISDELEKNPQLIENGPYQIAVPVSNEFSKSTFDRFAEHFIRYQENMKMRDNFGRSLEYFADTKNTQKCLEGIKSLFFYHRNRKATWFYFVVSFSTIENEFLRAQLAIYLTHIPGHMDIWWHKNNIIAEDVSQYALSLIKGKFRRKEVESLLNLVDEEMGFSRGSIGQCVHALIDVIPGHYTILKSIAFDNTLDEKMRFNALILLVCCIQNHSPDQSIQLISSYLENFPGSSFADMLMEIRNTIKEFGYVSFY
jgi:hypothetical protein